MATLDLIIIAGYLFGILLFSLWRSQPQTDSSVDYMLGGRKLTLPAFVATLVCNWYGGILGVGEYSFRYGLSNWFVFGLPYYVAALLFALFLAKKARRTEFITIPDRLRQCYGSGVAALGALVVAVWTLPIAYILILGVLGESFFGWSKIAGIVIGTILVTIYAYIGGFRSLARADRWHFVFMYLGFAVMFIALVSQYGGVDFLRAKLPATHFTWHGGNAMSFVAVWYVIALATLVEPSFYQSCYAAKDEKTARRGILVSIAFWFVFDFLTTSCGLYARALLDPNIDPIASYPLLGQKVLPVGLLGIFVVSLLATVISTADSYLFISASTIGKDLIAARNSLDEAAANQFTRYFLLIAALITIMITAFFDSVVTVWHAFGSIGTPILLVPLVSTFIGRRLMSPRSCLISMIVSGVTATLWLLSKNWTADGSYWLGWEPILPALGVSIAIYFTPAKAAETATRKP